MDSAKVLWSFLPVGYFFTILIETPVLLAALSARHSIRDRLIAGVWLTACTYPIVILVLPLVMADRTEAEYLWVAEIFAPAAECLLFWLVWIRGKPANSAATLRDLAAVTVANLASFGLGELAHHMQWL